MLITAEAKVNTPKKFLRKKSLRKVFTAFGLPPKGVSLLHI